MTLDLSLKQEQHVWFGASSSVATSSQDFAIVMIDATQISLFIMAGMKKGFGLDMCVYSLIVTIVI